ncbi:deoxyribodipyrimidine photo-lyase, partial [Candidatus Pelagibacter sp.]|nr:deoxyribodipyrimidine photo-lyase [Candidatus Pelagibacter sp.]
MTKKAIVWIREDFRIEDNEALAIASQNHKFVSALYIYNPKNFDKKREAQKWWISKALENFNLDLKKLNITLEVQLGDELEVLSNLKKKDDVTVYWSKVYEPDVINKGKKIR